MNGVALDPRAPQSAPSWLRVCATDDLLPFLGVGVQLGEAQVALFFVPCGANEADGDRPQYFAVGNYDPFGQAHVISRGIVGDLQGQLVVASPLYKQHFSLVTGQCLEDATVNLPTYAVRVVEHGVEILAPGTAP